MHDGSTNFAAIDILYKVQWALNEIDIVKWHSEKRCFTVPYVWIDLFFKFTHSWENLWHKKIEVNVLDWNQEVFVLLHVFGLIETTPKRKFVIFSFWFVRANTLYKLNWYRSGDNPIEQCFSTGSQALCFRSPKPV